MMLASLADGQLEGPNAPITSLEEVERLMEKSRERSSNMAEFERDFAFRLAPLASVDSWSLLSTPLLGFLPQLFACQLAALEALFARAC